MRRRAWALSRLDNLLNPGRPCRADGGGSGKPDGARAGHFPAKAKNVIYLFMAGGPSQLELFDDKPKLRELHGQPPPKSLHAKASGSPS